MRCGKRRSVRVKIGEVGKIAKREARAKAKVNYRDHVERLMADIAASTTLVSRCFHGEPPVRRGKSKSSSPPPRKRASGWAAWFRSAIGSTIGRSMSSRSMPSSCAMSFGVISRPAASCGSSCFGPGERPVADSNRRQGQDDRRRADRPGASLHPTRAGPSPAGSR